MKDNDGYELVAEQFASRGFLFKLVQVLDYNYRIYEKTNEKLKYKKYELVKLKKNEEYEIGGNKVEKRWSYPSDTAFGKGSYDCISIDRAMYFYEQEIKKIIKGESNGTPQKKRGRKKVDA